MGGHGCKLQFVLNRIRLNRNPVSRGLPVLQSWLSSWSMGITVTLLGYMLQVMLSILKVYSLLHMKLIYQSMMWFMHNDWLFVRLYYTVIIYYVLT